MTIDDPGAARILPQSASPPPGGPPPEKSARTADEAAKPSARILLVEDELLVARGNEDVLSEAGYEVVGIAADEARAMAMAESERPDLVLMDVRLARNSDGIEIAKTIRSRFDIPCLMVTAFGDDEARRRAQSARPRGWLIKPFTDVQLLDAVRQAVARSD